jgi:prepilin-type N-terminal cleavage/methylation domain-containing protein
MGVSAKKLIQGSVIYMKKMRNSKRGFTLTEIIIVVAIIVIVASAAFVGVAVVLNKAKASKEKLDGTHGTDADGKELFEAEAWEEIDELTKDAANFFDVSLYKPVHTNTPTVTPTPTETPNAGSGGESTNTPTPTNKPQSTNTNTPTPTTASSSGSGSGSGGSGNANNTYDTNGINIWNDGKTGNGQIGVTNTTGADLTAGHYTITVTFSNKVKVGGNVKVVSGNETNTVTFEPIYNETLTNNGRVQFYITMDSQDGKAMSITNVVVNKK